MGGAIFNDAGTLTVCTSAFTANAAVGGAGGGGQAQGAAGSGLGGAIFNNSGTVNLSPDTTFGSNTADQETDVFNNGGSVNSAVCGTGAPEPVSVPFGSTWALVVLLFALMGFGLMRLKH